MRRLMSIILWVTAQCALSWAQGASNTPTLAVLDFEPKGGVTVESADYLTDRVRIELFKTRKYRILEREAIKKILQEQNLELSGIAAPSATRVGELISADRLLMGNINRIDGKLILNLRMVNVATGEIEYGETFEAMKESELLNMSVRIARDMTSTGESSGLAAAKPEERSRKVSMDGLGTTLNYFMERINEVSNVVEQATELAARAPRQFDLGRIIEEQVRDTLGGGRGSVQPAQPSPIVLRSVEAQDEKAPDTDETDEENDSAVLAERARQELARRRGEGGRAEPSDPDAYTSSEDSQVHKSPSPSDDGEGSREGGRGGPAFRLGMLQGVDSLYYIGGQGRCYINSWFAIGGAGYAGYLVDEPAEKPLLGYGGLTLSVYNQHGPFGINLSVLLGGGALIVDSMDKPFMAAEVTLEGILRPVSWVDLRLGISYLATFPISTGVNRQDFTVGLSLLFGSGG